MELITEARCNGSSGCPSMAATMRSEGVNDRQKGGLGQSPLG